MELGEHFLSRKAFCEHHAEYEKNFKIEESCFDGLGIDGNLPSPILFQGEKEKFCFAINSNRSVINSYYIGTDWLTERKAVYVQPKFNKKSREQVNYLAMLFDALKHPDVFDHTKELFEIKWEKPEIKINQQQDMLTPLLVMQYLQLVKTIVRKGLKKSYYKVEHNLRSRVKGKVLIAKNIKQNLAKSKTLNTYCTFDEFGYNGIENRILKKALVFIERYLPTFQGIDNEATFNHTFNYIRPAFEMVSAEASMHECRHIKVNPLYKEYILAIDLAKQILRRFGYNIQNTAKAQVSTPPFWIDMSKLFELYVLGLLKDGYSHLGTIDYQFETNGNKLDYLLNVPDIQMVIDAKYKLKYNYGIVGHDDARQVSGYARLEGVYKRLGKDVSKKPYELIDCLIIYPKEEALGKDEKECINLMEKDPIEDYVAMHKVGVKLPVISNP